MTKFYEKNGIAFFKNPTDKFKTSTISVSIHCPLSLDAVTKNALLPFVLKRGCRALPTGEAVYNRLYEMYGANFMNHVTKKGEDQILSFGLDFASETYLPDNDPITDQALEFMDEIVFHPLVEQDSFSPEFVESEKQNLRSYIEGLLNDKKEYSIQRCVEEMFPGDPYSLYGYGKLDQLNGIDGKILYQQYLALMKTSRIDIFVSGDIAEEKVIQRFEPLANSRVEGEYAYPQSGAYQPKQEVKQVRQTMEVEQAKLCMGLYVPEFKSAEQYYTCAVLNTVFGGGPQSKLFNFVREKLSLCYYVFSRLDRQKSAMFIAAGIQGDDFQKAYDAILQQLDDVKNGKTSPEELDASKKYYINALHSMEDSIFQYEDYYTSCLIAGDIKTIDEVIQMVEAVTVEDITAFAKEIRLDTVYLLSSGQAEGR